MKNQIKRRKTSKPCQVTSLLIMVFLTLFAFTSCEKETIESEPSNSTSQTLTKDKTSNDKVCPGCVSEFLCELYCETGGFAVRVYRHPGGAIRYSYEPRDEIYVDYAYHTSNWATSTSNPYTYDYFLINNPSHNPNPAWKDPDGDVIIGGVYVYKLKSDRLPCDQAFHTNLLSGISNPCDMNTAVQHLSTSSNRPSSCYQGWYGGNGVFSQGIFCPGPVTNNVPRIPSRNISEQAAVVASFEGKYCLGGEGVCSLEEGGTEPNPPHFDPNIGPIFYDVQYENGQTSLKLHFMRDVQSNELILESSQQVVLPQDVIDLYGLPENSSLTYGSYPIVPTEYEFGYAIVPVAE